MTVATMNVYCGLHEAADMAFVLHVLRPGELFFDIGAKVGSYSILASGVAGAHTITLESIPATFDRLSRNIRLNDLLSSVDARCLAVGASEGSVRFTARRDTTNRAVSLLPSRTSLREGWPGGTGSCCALMQPPDRQSIDLTRLQVPDGHR